MVRHDGPARTRLFVVAWVVAAFGGSFLLTAYDLAPGESASAPAHWPLANREHLATARPTLVMSLHPLCACSRASVGELARMMTTLGERVHAILLLVVPDGVDESAIRRSDVLASARLVPSSEVLLDRGGSIARRFDARTSGQTYLYESDGRLVFAGGITAGRGHMGDSPGRLRILRYVLENASATGAPPVFGCGLADPDTTRTN